MITLYSADFTQTEKLVRISEVVKLEYLSKEKRL